MRRVHLQPHRSPRIPSPAISRWSRRRRARGTQEQPAENATRLVITSGTKAGAEFPLGHDEITIGRSSDSAIIIRDDYTSTHHARLMLWNGRWMIQDLDSTNGTFLDGSRVTVPTPIPLGSHRQGRRDDVRAATVAPMATVKASAAVSHVGRIRANNQDSGYAGRTLFLVADGMGGHAGGDVASAIATRRIAEADADYASTTEAAASLEGALIAANRELAETVGDHSELTGMGTTVSAMILQRRPGRHLAHRRLPHLPPALGRAQPDLHRPHLRAAARRRRSHHR